jgi:DNA uptake protein ComE-like DNA-binding protein
MHQLTDADREIYYALAALLTVTPQQHPCRALLEDAANTVTATDLQTLPTPPDCLHINTATGEIREWESWGQIEVETEDAG